ncbi:hypothetical protein TSUD_367570 [Trifolium subterraneum]|uniref:Uncharacterized protein n=1 Tax=Trifolium subterraneum TaxID=3900 RepID=A0A2Z6N6P5_TRISU|nr:hypothetical protein TSUD_367570 [Trifolium subterraneum]
MVIKHRAEQKTSIRPNPIQPTTKYSSRAGLFGLKNVRVKCYSFMRFEADGCGSKLSDPSVPTTDRSMG